MSVNLPLFTEPEIPNPPSVDIISSMVAPEAKVTVKFCPLLLTDIVLFPPTPISLSVVSVVIAPVVEELNSLESVLYPLVS